MSQIDFFGEDKTGGSTLLRALSGPRDQKLATPWEIVHWLEDRFDVDIVLDVCCEESTAKGQRFYTVEDDGLRQSWKTRDRGVAFWNPPFDSIPTWFAKASYEMGLGHPSIALLPSRTGRRWFHHAAEFSQRGLVEIVFFEGRIQYEGSGSSPFEDSLALYFKGD